MFYKNFLISLVALIFLFAPVANAMTIDELQARINVLLQQIAVLQKQLEEIQGVETPTWCHTFNTNLRIGEVSAEVGALRAALTKEGFSGLEAMGGAYTFDEKLASAVVAFQEKYASEVLAPWGLKHGTGYVGSSTRKKLNALYECGQEATPSITVISPNGGEQWMVGTTHQVQWKASAVTYVDISLRASVGGTADTYYIAKNISASPGYYNWTIPPLSQLGSDYSQDNYILYVIDSAKLASDGSDNYFTILASTTTPSITVTSPNGGESWPVGTTQTISWTSSNVTRISLDLVNASGNLVVKNLVNVSGNPDSANWTIPTFIQPGQYWMRVGTCPDSVTVCNTANSDPITIYDKSDSYFNIVAVQSVCTDSDGGENSSIKGTATKSTVTLTDNCNLRLFNGYNYQYNLVSSCVGSIDCFVNEAICSSSYMTNGVSGIGQKLINCPYGCSNGVCLTGPSDKPDLIVQDFQYKNLPPAGGDTYAYFDITIKNVGQATAILPGAGVKESDEFTVEVYKNSINLANKIATVTLGLPLFGMSVALEVNETYTMTNMTSSPNADLSDVSSLIVKIDTTNKVDELNENNNTITKAVITFEVFGLNLIESQLANISNAVQLLVEEIKKLLGQ